MTKDLNLWIFDIIMVLYARFIPEISLFSAQVAKKDWKFKKMRNPPFAK